MTFSYNILAHAFNQFSATESLRTGLLNSLLRDKTVDYCALSAPEGESRQFLVHNVESSWLAKSNGSPVIGVEVVDVETGEFRPMTMRVNRIITINGEETPKVTVAHFATTGREPTL